MSQSTPETLSDDQLSEDSHINLDLHAQIMTLLEGNNNNYASASDEAHPTGPTIFQAVSVAELNERNAQLEAMDTDNTDDTDEESSSDSTEATAMTTAVAAGLNRMITIFQALDTRIGELNQIVASGLESLAASTESQSIGTADTETNQSAGVVSTELATMGTPDTQFDQTAAVATDAENRASNIMACYNILAANRNRGLAARRAALSTAGSLIDQHADPFDIPQSGGYAPVMRSRMLETIERSDDPTTPPNSGMIHQDSETLRVNLLDRIRRLQGLIISRNRDDVFPLQRVSRRDQERAATLPQRANSVSDCSQCSSEDET